MPASGAIVNPDLRTFDISLNRVSDTLLALNDGVDNDTFSDESFLFKFNIKGSI